MNYLFIMQNKTKNTAQNDQIAQIQKQPYDVIINRIIWDSGSVRLLLHGWANPVVDCYISHPYHHHIINISISFHIQPDPM